MTALHFHFSISLRLVTDLFKINYCNLIILYLWFVEDCNKPHCFICTERKEFVGSRSLERSRESIDVFKALSSPTFILQASMDDPILEVFKLSEMMQQRKLNDPPFCVRNSEWFHFNWSRVGLHFQTTVQWYFGLPLGLKINWSKTHVYQVK